MDSKEEVKPEVWYRYEEVRYSPGTDEYGDPLPYRGRLEVKLDEYEVIKTTPKGVWIRLYSWGNEKRFILRGARKRYACPTKEEAIESFRARKERQRRILTSQLEDVNDALNYIKDHNMIKVKANPAFVDLAELSF